MPNEVYFLLLDTNDPRNIIQHYNTLYGALGGIDFSLDGEDSDAIILVNNGITTKDADVIWDARIDDYYRMNYILDRYNLHNEIIDRNNNILFYEPNPGTFVSKYYMKADDLRNMLVYDQQIPEETIFELLEEYEDDLDRLNPADLETIFYYDYKDSL